MKKIIFIAAHLAISQAYAQCTITSNSAMTSSQPISFTVDTKAQCEDCYQWSSPTLKILGSNKQNQVSVQATNAENSEISVLVLTNNGMQECTKKIEAIAVDEVDTTKSKCGILVNDFKEVKVDDTTVSFFPNANHPEYLYKWTATYNNGDKVESAEKIPIFKIGEHHTITTIVVQIISKSPICSTSVTKDYQNTFWKAPKENKFPQKEYIQSKYLDHTKVSY
ncbi:MAG: hypothetical protein KBS61_05800 [Chryseobacterium sp.]|nr:hypothetical protein [Candidatus Chryseobacterium enterohippi]